MKILNSIFAACLVLSASAQAADISIPAGTTNGGFEVTITNYAGTIGNGSDVTNVIFGPLNSTDILDQGTDWVKVVAPTTMFGLFHDISSESTSEGEVYLDTGIAYLEQEIQGDPLIVGIGALGSTHVSRKFSTNRYHTLEYFNYLHSYLKYETAASTNIFDTNDGNLFYQLKSSKTDAENIELTGTTGDLELRTILTYQDGDSYVKKTWEIVNTNSITYTNVSFLHGGDTFFANYDNSRGYWNEHLNMLYMRNDNSTMFVSFQGDSSSLADQYYQGDYYTNYRNMVAADLPNTVDTNYLDAGYSLQWNKSSLAPGETWTVTAFEKWWPEADVHVIPGTNLSATAGSSVTSVFTVINFQTNSDSFNLSFDLDQPGWTAAVSGSTNITLAGDASSNITAVITVGSGSDCTITLNIASASNSSITNGSSITVSGSKADQSITFPAIADQDGNNTLTLNATADSGLPVIYTNTAGSPVRWISTTSLTFTATGTVGIVASQPGDAAWNAATPVTNTFCVTSPPTSTHVINDYDGDGMSDLAVYDNDTGYWYILSLDGYVIAWEQQWGWEGAILVPGDYDGDGTADLAVFDDVEGYWYILSLDGYVIAWEQQWGWEGAVPVAGDYDGDGMFDLAVFDDEYTGNWYIMSLTGYVIAWEELWGWPGAVPVSGDYNGDGTYDLAVFDDESTGNWYILSIGEAVLAWEMYWGWPGAVPVSGDYDGDGIFDLTLFDDEYTGNWYTLSLDGYVVNWEQYWGWEGAIPIPGDYDGDGTYDLAVFDDEYTGNWYILNPSSGVIAWEEIWGWPGATPVSP